jgi:hypothetical protein
VLRSNGTLLSTTHGATGFRLQQIGMEREEVVVCYIFVILPIILNNGPVARIHPTYYRSTGSIQMSNIQMM